MHFEHKAIEHLAIGLTSGNCIIKLADKLMKDEYVQLIYSENSTGEKMFQRFDASADRRNSSLIKPGNNSGSGDIGESVEEVPDDKVTFIGFFTAPNRIIFGSKEGCVTTFNMTKKETHSFSIDTDNRSGMSRVL